MRTAADRGRAPAGLARHARAADAAGIALAVLLTLAAPAGLAASPPQRPEADPPPEEELVPAVPEAVVDSPLLLDGVGPEDPAPGQLEPVERSLLTPSPPAAPPPTVAAIEIRSDARLRSPGEVRALLAFEVGDPLTDEAVRRSLRNVQASGVATQVGIYTRPAPPAAAGPAIDVPALPPGAEATAAAAGPPAERVVAVVALWANLVVESVRVEGELGVFERGDLERALPQRPGEPLVESRMVRGVYTLQDRFEERGYFERQVQLVPEVDEESRTARVVYRVTSGPRATVGLVRFEGDVGPFGDDELAARLKLQRGQPFNAGTAEADADRLQRWLVDQGHRTARVDPPAVEYRSEADLVALTFTLEVGPKVEVEVVGADRGKLQKRGLLPFLGDEGYDEALVLQAVDRIRAHYQRQGHYRVEVESREETTDGTLRLTLEIRPGPQYTLQEVRLDGNQEISDGTLAELMETSGRSLLSLGSGRLVDDTLDADLDNLRSFYALQGYRQAEIGPPRVDEQGRDLVLTIPIHEGPRQLLAGLDFSGVEKLDSGDLRRSLPLTVNGPFHPRLLDESLNQVRARYEREGYDQAQVSARTLWNPDRTRAEVAVEVFEGPQTVVDRVIVRGNRKTTDEVIRRTVGLDPGEPVSSSRLLEIERELYRLGIFSRVDVDLTPAPLGATTRDVLVRVEEGRVQRLTYGLGYDTEDGVGGLFGYTHNNLFGKAFSLSLDARVRQQRQQFRAFLNQPYVARLKVPVTYSLFRLEEDRESFEVLKWGTRVDVVKDLGQRLRGARLALAYDYRIVENRVKADIVGTDLERQDQTLRISSLIPNFQLDRRDDPINPSRGWNSVAQLQYAFPLLSAEADFVKLFLQGTGYLDLGPGVVAASGRVGGIEPLTDLDFRDPLIPPGLELPSADVFIAERFFAGGSTTHRAFDRDRLGIPGRSLFPEVAGGLVPVGGNGLFLFNLDYRFPVAGPVGGTVFFDTGNVWADWRDLDPGDLRSGAGVGVRYNSPIGPVRLEIGFPIDRLPDDDTSVIFLALGNPF